MDGRMLGSARDHLLEERRRLVDHIEVLDGQFGLGESAKEMVGELSSYDNHPADNGTETFERSKDLALRDAARVQLHQVDAALARIESGLYGSCAACGRLIDEGRLTAVPHSILCIECKTKDEDWEDRFVRPIEEKVLRHAFSRTLTDGNAWQEVARFGTSETPQDVPGAVRMDELYADSDELRGSSVVLDSVADESDPDDVSGVVQEKEDDWVN